MEQHAYLETVDKETVDEGDFAIIDFKAMLMEEFPGGLLRNIPWR